MIQRYNEKLPVCSYCLKSGHSAFKCQQKPQKGLHSYAGLKVSSSFGGTRKPMKARGKVTNQWLKTRTEWFKQNPAETYKCHYCRAVMDKANTTLDHLQSRGRRPDLRFELSNLVPCCFMDNKNKGSKSHDEIPHSCNLVK